MANLLANRREISAIPRGLSTLAETDARSASSRVLKYLIEYFKSSEREWRLMGGTG